MSQSATIIDLDEVRRRRRRESAVPAAPAARPAVIWVPMWVIVPVWPLV